MSTPHVKSADAILASKSIERLRAALARGESQLALLDAEEQSEDAWDGPFPPSNGYEQWKADTTHEHRRLLELGMADVRAELARRATR